MRQTSLTTLRQFYAKNPPAHGTRLTREATSLATLRQVYAKNPSPRPRPVVPHAYQQTCSACRGSGCAPREINYKLNGSCACGGWNCPRLWAAKAIQSTRTDTPICGLCAGRGYVTGNGSARGGTQPAARDVEVDWQDAGLEIVHGATGNPVGRPRHDEATLKPATIRKRKSQPLKDHSEIREIFSSEDRARWAREQSARGEAGHVATLERTKRRAPSRHRSIAEGLDQWVALGVRNTPISGEGLSKFAWPSLVTHDLTAFLAVYEAYQAEIPSETHEFRMGQHPSRAELSAAFARLVDKEPSWTWEPMHAAVERIRPRDRREAAARMDHYWLEQTLNWRGGPCICGHDDIIHHLAATAPGADTRGGISREYVAGVVLDGAQRALELAMSAIARAS